MTKVGSMSSGTCMCEAGAEGRGAKPRCMIKGRARDEWGRGFLGGHMVWFWSLVCVRLASASITLESLTCVGKTESLRNQDARPRGSQGMSWKVF